MSARAAIVDALALVVGEAAAEECVAPILEAVESGDTIESAIGREVRRRARLPSMYGAAWVRPEADIELAIALAVSRATASDRSAALADTLDRLASKRTR